MQVRIPAEQKSVQMQIQPQDRHGAGADTRRAEEGVGADVAAGLQVRHDAGADTHRAEECAGADTRR